MGVEGVARLNKEFWDLPPLATPSLRGDPLGPPWAGPLGPKGAQGAQGPYFALFALFASEYY